ncbi:NAD(P)H-dependent oxidoreductase [Bacillus solimangrovi]|uniref:Flavodoxin n=1 Tax=Bacillus solimangrovi TaxID=1305675 RepID=A0A1E5LFD8_9BACI|nr:NAD(P)H-dependent oxidoreductase [Bacillus solimangrovi]OEH92791.1 flavodoxin [Bacillus solimangrovi]
MSKIFIVNGHEYYDFSPGRLNSTMIQKMIQEFKKHNHEIKTTIVQEGYNIKEEQEKFNWADVIIYQSPVHSFNLPLLFLKYFSELLKHFVTLDTEYGHGGLLQGKKYMFSLTMNAPEYSFGNKEKFFDGKSIDDLFFHVHKLQQFTGMTPLPTFALYDVMHNPDIDVYLSKLQKHLQQTFTLSEIQNI